MADFELNFSLFLVHGLSGDPYFVYILEIDTRKHLEMVKYPFSKIDKFIIVDIYVIKIVIMTLVYDILINS